MKQISLPFYKQFACLADKCPLNCCMPYRIGFFKWEEAQFDSNPVWKDVDGQGNCIRKYIEKDQDGWKLTKGKHGGCVFFEDNMCALQKRNGAMAQPSVCRTFPRLITQLEDRLELSMDPCCVNIPLMAKDWKLCEFEVTGEGELAYDEKYLKREKVFRMLTDESMSLKDCYSAMAAEYDVTIEVPEFNLSAEKEEFFRKMTGLLAWGYLIPYDGFPTIPNMMEFILKLMFRTKALFDRENVPDDWYQMCLSYTDLLKDAILEKDFDRDLEDVYLDVSSK